MVDPSLRRFQGRHVVKALLAALAITIVTALLFFYRGTTPSGRILGLRAEGDRSALLLRESAGKRRHVHLVRMLDDGSQPHKISLFGVQEGAVPFVVGDRVVVEAMTARGYPTVQAFQVRDLAFAYWGPEPSTTLEDGARGATVAATLGGRPVLVSVHRGSPGELLVLDASDGTEISRAPLEGVTSPAYLTLLEGEGVRVALEDGGFVDLDLRDGSAREGGVPVADARRCRVEDGRLRDGERDLGEFELEEGDALLAFDGGCLVRRGGRFEARSGAGARAFELDEARVGPTQDAHVAGSALFLIVDDDEVAIVDLETAGFRSPSRGLTIKALPAGDPSRP
jgi:hypothetical protein